jgi:prephenate dehydrogenase
MKLFNKVGIVGMGLIGGSLALAIKKRQLADEVVGVSRHKKSLLLAKKMGAIDKGSQEFDIIKNADLLILSTPVNTILKLAPKVSKAITKDCIVTDVGSTKKEIVSSLGKIFFNYIGSHPLAGSEKRGIINARAALFKNSLCILTPTKKTNTLALKKIESLWNKIGAKTILLNPSVHDKILSFTSHLPHLIAFSLMDTIPRKYLRFASGGLKDATRIASSDNRLWTDILLSNRKNVIKTVDLFQDNLSKIKFAIIRKNRKLLNNILKQAKNKRNGLSYKSSAGLNFPQPC